MNWQTAGETEAINASDIRFKLAFGGHLAHISDGIVHASERRVEADAFGRSNFLETHLLIIKHAHDVLLGLWQTADERIDFTEVSAEVILTLVDIILQTVCRHPFYFLTAKGVILRLLFSETVNDDIMGAAGGPARRGRHRPVPGHRAARVVGRSPGPWAPRRRARSPPHIRGQMT